MPRTKDFADFDSFFADFESIWGDFLFFATENDTKYITTTKVNCRPKTYQ